WGSWQRVETPYIGLVPLFLIGFAFTRKRSNPAWFFAALGLIGLLIALGKYTPIYSLFHALPVLGGLRVPARFILLTNFSLASLAAIGLHRLLNDDVTLGRMIKWSGLVVGIGLAALLIAYQPFQSAGHDERLDYAFGSFGVFAVLAFFGLWRHIEMKRSAAVFLIGLTAFELIVLGSTIETDSSDPTQGFNRAETAAYLRNDSNVFRIENASSAWQPDAALMHGLSDIGGIFNPLGLANYETYRGGMGNRGAALYNFLGAKYVLANKAEPPGDASFVPVFKADPQIDVYLNTRAVPRAMLIDDVQIVRSGEAAWQAIHAPEFDPSKSVVIETSEAIAIEPQAGDRALAWGAVTNDRVELAVQTPSPTMLVLSEVYYPGWIATIDDRPTPIYPANFAFRAVLVPGGSHRVVFVFEPVMWKIGLLISGATVAGLVVFAVRQWRSRRRGIAHCIVERRHPA
ncbi:MAG TPA: YfhO family protein, partial [Anaerolineae bacterium]|nr:YfhO family protein [Anaerolineae bacterium]